jgi:hypothetical protein
MNRPSQRSNRKWSSRLWPAAAVLAGGSVILATGGLVIPATGSCRGRNAGPPPQESVGGYAHPTFFEPLDPPLLAPGNTDQVSTFLDTI